MSDYSPLVSAIIPVHNRSTELHRAVLSALSQDYAHIEVLVMDDASTEDLSRVVDAFNDRRVILYRKEEKSNANVLRNMGINYAKGEYVAFLDSDDEWLPDHISSKLRELEQSGAHGVFGSSFIDDGKEKRYAGSREFAQELTYAEYLLSIGFAPIPSWVLKRDAALAVLFDESLHRHQDYDFFVRFADQFSWKVSWRPTIVIHWRAGEKRRRHPGSEIQFIRKNFNKISPRIYFRYQLTQLGIYLSEGASPEVIAYYRRESKRYIHHLSFVDYCTIYPERKGVAGFVISWISFSALILVRKFRKPGPLKAPFAPGE